MYIRNCWQWTQPDSTRPSHKNFVIDPILKASSVVRRTSFFGKIGRIASEECVLNSSKENVLKFLYNVKRSDFRTLDFVTDRLFMTLLKRITQKLLGNVSDFFSFLNCRVLKSLKGQLNFSLYFMQVALILYTLVKPIIFVSYFKLHQYFLVQFVYFVHHLLGKIKISSANRGYILPVFNSCLAVVGRLHCSPAPRFGGCETEFVLDKELRPVWNSFRLKTVLL